MGKCRIEAKSSKETGGRDAVVGFSVEMGEEGGDLVMCVWGVGRAQIGIVNECEPGFGRFLQIV